MKGFFGVIFQNLIGFDMIIFLLAIVNGIFYHFTKRATDELYRKMHLTVFVPGSHQSQQEAQQALSELREGEVVRMRNLMGRLYSVFVNITGIFPLLGILGTVVSLLGLVADNTDVTGNFYGALTSTFWGLVFAIIFKFLDGVISSKIEDNEKSVELFLTRNYRPEADKTVNREPETALIEEKVGAHSSEKKGLELFKELFLGGEDDGNGGDYEE